MPERLFSLGAATETLNPSSTIRNDTTVVWFLRIVTLVLSLLILWTGTVFAVPSATPGHLILAASPDFTMAANPSNQTVVAGSSGKSLVILTSINGFSGVVNLATSPPPLCASCPGWGLNSSSVKLSSGGTASSTLTFVSTAGSPPRNWVVVVTGTSGSLSHNVSVTFTVVPSSPPPDFTITANPNRLNIPAGTTGKSTITLTSLNSFSGTVNLYTSPSPLCPSPQCSTWSIDPTSANLSPDGSATATLSIFGGTQGGYGNVTVYGNSGSLSHSVIVSFKITQPPDFTITISPSSQTVRKGSITTFSINVTGTNGFNNTVDLSTTISPVTRHGPTTSLPSTVGPYSTSTLTVSTMRGTQLGTYTITVTATSGSLTHTFTVTVTVTS